MSVARAWYDYNGALILTRYQHDLISRMYAQDETEPQVCVCFDGVRTLRYQPPPIWVDIIDPNTCVPYIRFVDDEDEHLGAYPVTTEQLALIRKKIPDHNIDDMIVYVTPYIDQLIRNRSKIGVVNMSHDLYRDVEMSCRLRDRSDDHPHTQFIPWQYSWYDRWIMLAIDAYERDQRRYCVVAENIARHILRYLNIIGSNCRYPGFIFIVNMDAARPRYVTEVMGFRRDVPTSQQDNINLWKAIGQRVEALGEPMEKIPIILDTRKMRTLWNIVQPERCESSTQSIIRTLNKDRREFFGRTVRNVLCLLLHTLLVKHHREGELCK